MTTKAAESTSNDLSELVTELVNANRSSVDFLCYSCSEIFKSPTIVQALIVQGVGATVCADKTCIQ